jgi:hypothetical protein
MRKSDTRPTDKDIVLITAESPRPQIRSANATMPASLYVEMFCRRFRLQYIVVRQIAVRTADRHVVLRQRLEVVDGVADREVSFSNSP